MQVYETNAGLGYLDVAYLLKLKEDVYMVLDTNNSYYKIGSVIELEDYYAEPCDKIVESFLIYNEYLFKVFYNQLKRLQENKYIAVSKKDLILL